MSAFAIAVIVCGVSLCVVVGVAVGLDATSAALLALIAAVGGLGVAVARRSRSDSVGPARCPHCGGLISPNAPYCKHCGAPSSGH